MSIPSDVRAAVMRRAATHVICECHDEGHAVCEDCWRCDVPLELHHLRYWIIGDDGFEEDIDGKETEADLDVLCRDCHHARHLDLNGEFWRDPEEMETHWWTFYNEMSKE